MQKSALGTALDANTSRRKNEYERRTSITSRRKNECERRTSNIERPTSNIRGESNSQTGPSFALGSLRFDVGCSMFDVRCSRCQRAARSSLPIQNPKFSPSSLFLAPGAATANKEPLGERWLDRRAPSSSNPKSKIRLSHLQENAARRTSNTSRRKNECERRTSNIERPTSNIRGESNSQTGPSFALGSLRFDVGCSMFDVRCSMFDVRLSSEPRAALSQSKIQNFPNPIPMKRKYSVPLRRKV